MLSELSIENFAIIDKLLVRFDSGFTVITGETGAGKSIIVDALQTVLGARVGTDVVRAGARLASVEAIFDTGPEHLALLPLLEDAGIEPEESLILRREINAGGRGAARVNGRAVPLATLSQIGSLLVDIHGQSDHLSVLRRDRQLEVLDRYGDLLDLRREVSEALREYALLHRQIEDLLGGRREAERRLDLLRFQAGEIEAANLRPGEGEDLEAERNLLVNAERLAGLAVTARDRLHGEGVDAVAQAVTALRDLSNIDPSMQPLAARLESAQVEMEDIAQDLRRYGDGIEHDPRRLEAVEDRLDLLRRLQRKYGATVEEVLAFGASVRSEIEEIENVDDRLADLQERGRAAEERAGRAAEELSRRRCEVAGRLSAAMRDALLGLGLKGTGFDVQLTRTPSPDGLLLPGSGERFAYSSSGIDTAVFVVSFNPGEELRPLDRVASGGETSRFLLALKSVLAGADATPTLVFDEVDVGVGGRHGTVVGERLRSLAADHQVLSITHLPQVAALGDHHLSVAKAVVDGRTTVRVADLERDDRVGEIAEMMSGTGSETARRNAEELLEAAHGA